MLDGYDDGLATGRLAMFGVNANNVPTGNWGLDADGLVECES